MTFPVPLIESIAKPELECIATWVFFVCSHVSYTPWDFKFNEGEKPYVFNTPKEFLTLIKMQMFVIWLHRLSRNEAYENYQRCVINDSPTQPPCPL